MIWRMLGIVLVAAAMVLGDSPREQDAKYKDLAAKLETAKGAELETLRSELIKGGMRAHDAIKTGPASTEKIRREIRREIRARRDAEAIAKGLVMHEWGVLTIAQGVDRMTLGLQAGSSDLPGFVQQWSTIPGEKPAGQHFQLDGIRIDPVVWFYSKTPESMNFTVACPRGVLTNWYPNATRVLPALGSVDLKKETPSGGMLVWKNLDIAAGEGKLQAATEQAWWWPVCRETGSATVKMNDQAEKFLYYAGILADAPLPLEVEGGQGQKYTLHNRSKEAVRDVLVIQVGEGTSLFQSIPQIDAKSSAKIDASLGKGAGKAKAVAERAQQAIAELLEERGLFAKEAAAAAKIAKRQWMEKPGVRMICFCSAEQTASLLPVRMDPAPASRARVLMVAYECMADSLDNVISKLIAQLGDDQFKAREEASRRLIELGPRVVPLLVPAMKKAKDTEIRGRLAAILQKIDPKNQALREMSQKEEQSGPQDLPE